MSNAQTQKRELSTPSKHKTPQVYQLLLIAQSPQTQEVLQQQLQTLFSSFLEKQEIWKCSWVQSTNESFTIIDQNSPDLVILCEDIGVLSNERWLLALRNQRQHRSFPLLFIGSILPQGIQNFCYRQISLQQIENLEDLEDHVIQLQHQWQIRPNSKTTQSFPSTVQFTFLSSQNNTQQPELSYCVSSQPPKQPPPNTYLHQTPLTQPSYRELQQWTQSLYLTLRST